MQSFFQQAESMDSTGGTPRTPSCSPQEWPSLDNSKATASRPRSAGFWARAPQSQRKARAGLRDVLIEPETVTRGSEDVSVHCNSPRGDGEPTAEQKVVEEEEAAEESPSSDAGSPVASDTEDGLFEHVCLACNARRVLPFRFDGEFQCQEVGLSCGPDDDDESVEGDELEQQDGEEQPDSEAELLAHTCHQCGLERFLPYDFGETFSCEDVGLACGVGDDDDHSEAIEHTCFCCGSSRWLPHQFDGNFACWEIGIPCLDIESEEETSDAHRLAAIPEEGEEEAVEAERKEKERANLRIQLLWKVLIYQMATPDALQMFMDEGFDPPDDAELADLRSNTLETFRRKTQSARSAAKSALKTQSKKGQVKRFLNNEIVSVSKKDKCVREEKESAEDKAKTSVELYVIGIGRGGRHAVKIARDPKKKGPVSRVK